MPSFCLLLIILLKTRQASYKRKKFFKIGYIVTFRNLDYTKFVG